MVKKGNLFLTIKGKKNNGKKFIFKALKKGAQGIVSSQKIKNYKKLLIKVPNELKFLNNFALKKLLKQDFSHNRKLRKNFIKRFN